jgi:hypothetical protein
MRSLARVLALGLVSALAVGCAAESDEASGENAGAASRTKFRTIWQDLRGLDGSGWTKVLGEVASDKIQDQISTDLLGLDWDVKAASTGANVTSSTLPGMSVYDLDTIATGLLQRFGDTELPAKVNAVRRDNVQGGYYLDAAMTAGLRGSKSWSIKGPDSTNFTSSISFGFDAGAEVTARAVVHSPKDKIGDEAKAWLKNLVGARDYFFSQKAEKVDEMKAGEMWGLRGKGRLGAHIGLDAPVAITGPLSVVFHGGFSGNLEGLIDVQVVKLDGGQVVVDLGIQDGALGGWSVGVGTSYGVPSICKDSETGQNGACLPTLAGGALDLKKIVPNIAQNLLNDYLGFHATTGGSKGSQRLSVLRMRFDFGAATGDAATEARAAFARAIRFDARHAQTLHHQQAGTARPSVVVEADLFRQMATSTRYTDFNALGFSVYKSDETTKEGAMTLRTPTDTQVVTYSVRNKRSGWFQTSHGFDRMAFASTSNKGSQANLVFNVATADKHLDARGLLTENADAVLLAAGGRSSIEALDAFGNGLEGRVRGCEANNDACVYSALGGADQASATASFLKMRESEAGKAAVRGIPEGYGPFITEVAQMRLSGQALAFTPDVMQGPSLDFTFGLRVDDKGLDEMMNPDSVEDFKAKAYAYLLTATSIERADMAGISREDLLKRIKGEPVTGVLDDPKWPVYKDLVDDLARVYVQSSAKYRQVRVTEADARSAMKDYEGRFSPVFVGLDMNTVNALGDRAKAQKAFTSLAHQGALASAELVDNLNKTASGEIQRATHLWGEHLVGYTLAQMVSPENRELSVDLRIAGDVTKRFAAAGLGTWVGSKPLVVGKVSKVSLGPLDLVATAKTE